MFGKTSTRTTTCLLIATCIIVCISFAGLSLQYYKKLQTTIRSESSDYLHEVSKQISYNANRAINNNFAVLGLVSTVLKNSNISTQAQFQSIVQAQRELWSFQNILLIDQDSIAYDAYGKKIILGNDLPLQEAILDKKPSMFTSKVIDGKECIVFLIPLDVLVIENKPMHALAVAYDLHTFDQILSLNAFDGQSYAHIVKNNGTVVIRSSAIEAPKLGYNVISALEYSVANIGDTVSKMKSDLLVGKSGFINYDLAGVAKYMIYTPLPSKDWALITIVPVAAVSAKSQVFLRTTLIICGLITLTFALLLAILLRSSYKHRRHLEQIAYIDPVTGGHTRQKFIELVKDTLRQSTTSPHALIFTNIEKFKVLNEQFGRKTCDHLLQRIHMIVSDDLSDTECIGRISADNYCILVKYRTEDALIARINQWYADISRLNDDDKFWLSPMLEFGIYILGDDAHKTDIELMIDRAKVSLIEEIGEVRGRLRYSFYNTQIGERLLREGQLESIMEHALVQREFIVYLQPKYSTKSEEIIGAEALVRWYSSEHGMIYPLDFIPLFEKNGFIIQLDLYVFEEVCRTIKKWIDAGVDPVKISINCSRVQMKRPNFLERYVAIVERYQIPFKYLELELTESVVFEDVDHLTYLIGRIRSYGFGCSMDDFGSGYSSLSLIQDIPIDTIKLDKVFLKNMTDLGRTKSVIGSIIAMSHALDIHTVAEGVETKEQVDMLKHLKCDLIQGYYYAKPMPIEDFEELKFGMKFAFSDI